MSSNEKIYGLMVNHREQEPLITKICFGTCGQISIAGALMDEMVGGLFICCQEKCPYLKKQTDEPIGEHRWQNERGDTTYDVYLRLIQATPVEQHPKREHG